MSNQINLEVFTLNQTGINPRLMYCSVTGKAIGTLNHESWNDLLLEVRNLDDDEAADDLMIRTLMSARPSPAWSSITPEGLKAYIKSRPVELLAYLLNRLYDRGARLQLTQDQRITKYHDRITTYFHAKRFVSEGMDCDWWLSALLEVDAKLDLRKIELPANELVLTHSASHNINAAEWRTMWEAWLEKHLTRYEESVKRAAKEAKFFAQNGNRLTYAAFFTTWMERKPASKGEEKRREKAKTESFVENLLDSILAGNHTHESTYVPKQTKAKPVFNFAKYNDAVKKESRNV